MKIVGTMFFAAALAGCGAMPDQHMGMAGASRPMMQGCSMMQRGSPMHAGSTTQGGMCGMGSQDGGVSGTQGMCSMAKGMRAMDSNKDGMVSKEEYLAAHGAKFDSMKKNERGQVATADMGMCPMMSGARRQ